MTVLWLVSEVHQTSLLKYSLNNNINNNNNNSNNNNYYLRFGVKSLYPGQKVSSVQVVFDFLAAHAINFAKELADIFDMCRHAKLAVQPRA